MAKRSKGELTVSSTSPAEWVVAAMGAAIIFSAIGYLIYFESFLQTSGPVIRVDSQRVVRVSEGYLVEFTVHNESALSVATMRVRGEVHRNGSVSDAAETVFDYLPAFSSRRGGLYLRVDPQGADLRLFPVSFVEP